MIVAGDQRDDAALEVLSGTGRGVAQSLHENAGTHDSLEAAPADALGDMEKPVSILNLGRFFDKETRFNSVGHGLPPTLNATHDSVNGFVNERQQFASVLPCSDAGACDDGPLHAPPFFRTEN